jgi:phosphoglycolate phosphatase
MELDLMLDAVIFDKDGTLFDFRLSWGAFTQSLLAEIAGDAETARALGQVLGYDTDSRQFTATSPVIAMTTPEIAAI